VFISCNWRDCGDCGQCERTAPFTPLMGSQLGQGALGKPRSARIESKREVSKRKESAGLTERENVGGIQRC
jgi:hypothetical protein